MEIEIRPDFFNGVIIVRDEEGLAAVGRWLQESDVEYEAEETEETVECPHPRTYDSGPRKGLCTLCGEPADDTVPEHRPVREFEPIPILPHHIPVMNALIQRGEITTMELKEMFGLMGSQLNTHTIYLKQKGLIERVPGHWAWQVTPLAKSRGFVPS